MSFGHAIFDVGPQALMRPSSSRSSDIALPRSLRSSPRLSRACTAVTSLYVELALHVALTAGMQADIKSETSGNFENALVALVTDPVEYDCEVLRSAMKGAGTNEKLIVGTS